MRRNCYSNAPNDHEAQLWEKQAARMVLYRTRDVDLSKALGMSGAAIVAERTREGHSVKEWAVAGFQSFVQPANYAPLPFMTEERTSELAKESEDNLRKALRSGTVAFYGAFSVPQELQEKHTIIF